MHFPPKIIVDTGPFFDFLLSEFWAHYYKKIPYKRLRYIKNEILRRKLRNYFYNTALSTTPSVIVEIAYQIRGQRPKLEPKIIAVFWKFVYNFFKNKKLDEDFISILNMSQEELAKFGPADASLIELARSTRMPIFTADSPLFFYCRSIKISALFIYELTEMPV